MAGHTLVPPWQGEADSLPTMDELLLRYDGLARVRKLGEGTFGEAFGTGARVFKVIPLAGDRLVNGEAQKSPEEILAEAAITLALSHLRDSGTFAVVGGGGGGLWAWRVGWLGGHVAL